jgi:hypothetical protein
VATFLCLDESITQRALVPSLNERSRATFHADLYALRTAWWHASRAEEVVTLGPSGAASDAALVSVDAALAAGLLYSPIPKRASELWLFAELPHKLSEQLKSTPVLVSDPAQALLQQLPRVVARLLADHRDCLVLAGGAVLGAVARYVQPGTDLDLFLYGLSAEASAQVLAKIEARVEEQCKGRVTARTQAATAKARLGGWASGASVGACSAGARPVLAGLGALESVGEGGAASNCLRASGRGGRWGASARALAAGLGARRAWRKAHGSASPRAHHPRGEPAPRALFYCCCLQKVSSRLKSRQKADLSGATW